MPKVKLSKGMELDEIQSYLQKKMDQYAVSIKGARVWVTDGVFKGCYVKPKSKDGAISLYFAGDMPGEGRMYMLIGLLAAAGFVYAATEVIVGAGLIVVLGVFALRKFPSSALQGKVKAELEELSAEA